MVTCYLKFDFHFGRRWSEHELMADILRNVDNFVFLWGCQQHSSYWWVVVSTMLSIWEEDEANQELITGFWGVLILFFSWWCQLHSSYFPLVASNFLTIWKEDETNQNLMTRILRSYYNVIFCGDVNCSMLCNLSNTLRS